MASYIAMTIIDRVYPTNTAVSPVRTRIQIMIVRKSLTDCPLV